MRKILLLLLTVIFVIFQAASLLALPRVIGYPKLLTSTAGSISVYWDDSPGVYNNDSELIYGISPSKYTGSIAQSQDGAVTFTPTVEGMTGGVYYCRISDTVDDSWSDEFKLFVEKPAAPTILSPTNGAALSTISPVFQWQAVSGVPFYTVAVFDTEVFLDISEGKVSITANAIWAATTDGTSIMYGVDDPMGYYDKIKPPPLMAGQTYTWMLLNNYSGSPSLVSENYLSMSSFTVTPISAASAPLLVTPVAGELVISNPILAWEAGATVANNYEVHLLKEEIADGEAIAGNGALPLWSVITSGTNVTVPANVPLGNADYMWYVIGLDATGKGMVSEKRSFSHNATTQEFLSKIWEKGPLGDEYVPRCMVYIETTTGGDLNAFPYTSDDTGFGVFLEPGTYKFIIKKEGYDTAQFVSNTATAPFKFFLTKSPYSITGTVRDSATLSPIQGAQLTATYNGVTVQTNSLADGSYIFYVSSINTWEVGINKTGYKSITKTVNVTGNPTAAGNVFMVKNLNILSGNVTNEFAQGINGVDVHVFKNGDPSTSYDTVTNISGGYSLNLPDGTWIIQVSKSGFVSPPDSSAVLSLGSSVVRNFVMDSQSNQISGEVTFGGSAFEGVLVRAVPTTGDSVETLTDVFGQYTLSVGAKNYTVNAILNGYVSDGAQTANFALLTPPQIQTGTDFVMSTSATPHNSDVYVYADNAGSPVVGVDILFSGTDPANTGYTYSAISGEYGDVTITAMAPGNYSVAITKIGYLNYSSTELAVNGSTVIHLATMIPSALNGDVGGLVTDGFLPLEGIIIELYEAASPDTPVATTGTASNGGYYFTVPVGEYFVKPASGNYTSTPFLSDVNIVVGIPAVKNFTVEQISGGGVIITQPVTKIYNENIGGPYLFTASLMDSQGKVVDTPITWSLNPPQAGQIGANGLLTPTADFMGDVSVIASALNSSSDTKTNVYQKIDSSYGAISVRDYRGFALSIPANASDPSNALGEITMTRETATRGKGSSTSKRVVSDIYNLSDGYEFLADATLTLPIASEFAGSAAAIGVWNDTYIKWDMLGGTSSGNGVSIGIDHFSDYAVLANMEELGMFYVDIKPNPFSPLINGKINIKYSIKSTATTSVETTIKIFNINGKHIKTIIDKEFRSTGVENIDSWDGRYENGKWAANGRYFAQIEIKDTSGYKQYIYTIALVK